MVKEYSVTASGVAIAIVQLEASIREFNARAESYEKMSLFAPNELNRDHWAELAINVRKDGEELQKVIDFLRDLS